MRSVSLLLLSLVALPLSAGWFEVSPSAPTPFTPISILFMTEAWPTCGPTVSDVQRSGTAIHVALSVAPGSGCGGDVNPRQISVPLGILPIGQYTFSAEFERLRWEGTFVVRNPFQHLAVVPVSGGPVNFCCVGSVNTVSIAGGPPLTPTIGPNAIEMIAPPHPSGLYDVKFATTYGDIVQQAAIYYFDPAVAADQTVFEPVLFPVLTGGPGAAGTRWTSRATISNIGDFYIQNYNAIAGRQCVDASCFRPAPPRSSFEFEGAGFPHGAIVYTPRGEPVKFALRIAETSRSSEFGVELMPVRESGFFRKSLTLVDVPVSNAFRTKLRIYALDPVPFPEVFVSPIGEVILRRETNETAEPWYAEVDLQNVAALRVVDKVTITISQRFGNTPIWAFASAIQNDQQRLFLVTAQ